MDKVIARKNGTTYEVTMGDIVFELTNPGLEKKTGRHWFKLPEEVVKATNRKLICVEVLDKRTEVVINEKAERTVSSTEGKTTNDWKSYLDETELSVVATLEEQLKQYKELACTRKNDPELKAKAALQKKIAAERARLAKYEAELAGLNE